MRTQISAGIPPLPHFPSDTIQSQFELFVQKNPAIYKLFVSKSLSLKRSGFASYSSDAILHSIRFDLDVKTKGETFKLNNNYSSRFARKAMSEVQDLEGFFRVRPLEYERY